MTTQADCSGAPVQRTSLASQGANHVLIGGLPPETWFTPNVNDALTIIAIRSHVNRCVKCKSDGTACEDGSSLAAFFEENRKYMGYLESRPE